MRITYDPAKRGATLKARNLDFDDAPAVFAGPHFEIEDDRMDYGEIRWITVGLSGDQLVAVVWTPRDGARRIISMRKCNAREREKYESRLDRSG